MKKIVLFLSLITLTSLTMHCLLDSTTTDSYTFPPLALKAQGSLLFNFDVKPAFLAYDGFHYDTINENDFDIFGSQDDELITAFHYTLIALKQAGLSEPISPIGAAQFFIFDRHPTNAPKEKIGLLTRLHIHHDSHNHKFNSFILETVIQFLKLKECTTIIIDLLPSHDAAATHFKKELEFYKRHGFTVTECQEEDILRLHYNAEHEYTFSPKELQKYQAMAHQLMTMEEHIIQPISLNKTMCITLSDNN